MHTISPAFRLTARASRTQRRQFFSLNDISKLAGMTPGLKESAGVESDGEGQRFHARKILPYVDIPPSSQGRLGFDPSHRRYSQSQLYSLVSDVPSYSSFIPFCHSSTVLAPVPSGTPVNQRRLAADWKPDNKPFEVEAELKVGFGGLEERYISKVSGKPFESVTVRISADSTDLRQPHPERRIYSNRSSQLGRSRPHPLSRRMPRPVLHHLRTHHSFQTRPKRGLPIKAQHC